MQQATTPFTIESVGPFYQKQLILNAVYLGGTHEGQIQSTGFEPRTSGVVGTNPLTPGPSIPSAAGVNHKTEDRRTSEHLIPT